jgi:DNA gyrase inhibitor GyrI
VEKNARDELVRFVDFEDTRIAVLEHRGEPASLGESIRPLK